MLTTVGGKMLAQTHEYIPAISCTCDMFRVLQMTKTNGLMCYQNLEEKDKLFINK